MAGTGIQKDDASSYDEISAAASGLTLDQGWKLMGRFLASDSS
jgi:hypothetical protein